MVKSSFITTVAYASLICAYTSAAGAPDDAGDRAQMLRKSTRKLEEPTGVIAGKVDNVEDPDPLTMYEQMMNEQGVDRDLQNVRTGNKGPRPTANDVARAINDDDDFARAIDDDEFGSAEDTVMCFGNPSRCGCEHLKHSDYRGTQSTTTSGHRCKAWSNADDFPDDGLDDGPYCRNPMGAGEGPFCFVEDNGLRVHWEYCRVPTCGTVTEGVRTFTGVQSTNSAAGVSGCVSKDELINLEFDVEKLLNSQPNQFQRSFHLGGIIRLSAHDFMDYNENASEKMGSDGCLDWGHKNNKGLREIWAVGSPWYELKKNKYPGMSDPDFWIVCSMIVIKLASSGEHNMMHTFLWGRKRASSCNGSGDRLPKGEHCKDNQEVFLDRMGLTWRDATALLGAHTVGRGQSRVSWMHLSCTFVDFKWHSIEANTLYSLSILRLPQLSGHEGTWMPNVEKAMIWDKGFYEEMVQRAWAPRNENQDNQDFMAGPAESAFPKMMLNTDICLAFDIDTAASNKCCTNINMINPRDGKNRCGIYETNQCKRIDSTHPRAESAQAVLEFLGGNNRNLDSSRWYRAFTEAWTKATINGHLELWPVQETCN